MFKRYQRSFIIFIAVMGIISLLSLFFMLHSNNTFTPYFRKFYKKDRTRLIVVSKYLEDISWLDWYFPHIPHIVYDRLNPQPPHVVDSNRGHEASTYVKFIHDYYENLPENIVFVHAHRRSWHCKDIVSILENLYWGKFDYVSLNPSFFQFMNSSHVEYLTVAKYWPQLFKDRLGDLPPVIKPWCCATFHVKRERILRHPKSFYWKLYEWLQSGELENYWSSRVLEHTWDLIFASNNLDTDINLCDVVNCNNMVGHREYFFKTVNGRLRELSLAEKYALFRIKR